MKKILFFGLLIAMAASGLMIAGCDIFAEKDEEVPTTYEPLILKGRAINGDDVEIEITRGTVPRAVLTPMTGDNYVMRVNRQEISRGTIGLGENRMIFYPNNSGEPFAATYGGGSLDEVLVFLYELPKEDGEVITILPPSGGGGGGGSTGWTSPPAEIFFEANTQKELEYRINYIRYDTNFSLEPGQKAVIRLTESFYKEANDGGEYIVLGADIVPNTKPFTIRGLGKGETGDKRVLKVGVWIANDNITLEQVKFEIIKTTDTNVMETVFGGSGYKVGVLIARGDDSNPPAIVGPGNNVTIQNCTINIESGGGFIAGVWVEGSPYNETFTSADVVGGKNIVIKDNVINATGYNTSAAHALGIRRWEPIIITGNKLYAKYGGPVRPHGTTIGGPANSPVSGLFVNAIYADSNFGNTVISGNDFSPGNSTAILDQFSWFVNLYPEKGKMPSYTTNIVSELEVLSFGNKETKWATTNTSSPTEYRRLYNALVAELKGKDGFGSFGLAVKYIAPVSPATNPQWDWVREFYQFEKGTLTYISYWGYDLIDANNPGKGYNVNSSNPPFDGDVMGGFKTTPGATRPSAKTKNFSSYYDRWWKNFSTPQYSGENTLAP